MDEDDTFTCRIQYINDADPFATTSSSYLEPMRPVTFKFRLHECISDQLQDVIRTLRAPHKAGDSSLQVYRGLEGGGGELHTYLDNDMTLSDQQEELDILKADTILDVPFMYGPREVDLVAQGAAPLPAELRMVQAGAAERRFGVINSKKALKIFCLRSLECGKLLRAKITM